MLNRTTIAIFLILASLLGLIIVWNFEYVEERDYSWRRSFDYDKEKPYDTKVFAELLKKKYGSDKVIISEEEHSLDSTEENTLYICLDSKIRYNRQDEETIRQFIESGNNALLVGHNIDFEIPRDPNLIDTIVVDSMINLDYEIWRREDSIFYMSEVAFVDSNLNYKYVHHSKNIDKANTTWFSNFNTTNEIGLRTIGYTSDSLGYFGSIELGQGKLYVHTVPLLFSNIGTEQSYYLKHFNEVFSHFNASKIILAKPSDLFRSNSNQAGRNPLQYIMANSPLRWTYFLLVASLLLYAIFFGKRKQNIIPTIPEKENTSMSYVRTLSSLFLQQNQNHKLVKHLRDGFMHKVKGKYFLDPKDKEFSMKLASKSKVNIQEVQNLLHKLNSSGGSEYSDDQLINLYRQIESFHQKAK